MKTKKPTFGDKMKEVKAKKEQALTDIKQLQQVRLDKTIENVRNNPQI